MTDKLNKLAYAALSLVFLVVSCLIPSISSAEDSSANMEAQIKILAETNVLSVIPKKGTCDSLIFKVIAKHVFKVVNIPPDQFQIAIPYEIYWYPDSKHDFANGKKVDHGIFNVKKDTQSFYVKYDPKKNPHGTKGEYVLKVKLKVNDRVIDKNLSAKLAIKVNCKANVPEGGNTPGTPEQPGNNDSPSGANDGKQLNRNPNRGGVLPITAADYGNGIVLSIMWMLLGIALYNLPVHNKKDSVLWLNLKRFGRKQAFGLADKIGGSDV